MRVIFLGVGLLFLRSCIWIVSQTEKFGPGGMKQRLLRCWENMLQWVRDHGLVCSQKRFSKLQLQLHTTLSYPDLKAKAHNCRIMLAWMADLLMELLAEGVEFTDCDVRHVACAAWALADFCALCDYNRRGWASSLSKFSLNGLPFRENQKAVP